MALGNAYDRAPRREIYEIRAEAFELGRTAAL